MLSYHVLISQLCLDAVCQWNKWMIYSQAIRFFNPAGLFYACAFFFIYYLNIMIMFYILGIGLLWFSGFLPHLILISLKQSVIHISSFCQVLQCCSLFPILETLYVSANAMQMLEEPQCCLQQLTTLSLENNNISSWDEVMKLGKLQQWVFAAAN